MADVTYLSENWLCSNGEGLILIHAGGRLRLERGNLQVVRPEIHAWLTAESPQVCETPAPPKCQALTRWGEVNTSQDITLCLDLQKGA